MLKINSASIRFENRNSLLTLALKGDEIPHISYFGLKREKKEFTFDKGASPTIFSCFGSLNYQRCSFGYIDEERNFSHRFRLKSVQAEQKSVSLPRLPSCHGEREILHLAYLDLEGKMEVHQYISSYPDENVFASSFSFRNVSKETLIIDKASSLQLELPGNDYEIISFHGDWGRERKINRTKLEQGEFVLSSTCGISSAYVNPFFMLRKGRKYFAFNMLYSGNHKESISVSPSASTRVITGLNDDYFSCPLAPSESFFTPEAIFACGKSVNEIKTTLNSFTERRILNRKENPIVFNTWEAIGAKLKKNDWQELARLAAKAGCDTFVFDDGWYAKRDDEKTSLGDFYLNKEKLGGDFAFINDYLAKLHLKLGLWIEPEMASPDSDLARNHPEFLLKTDGVEPLLKRNQYVLDMSNPAVTAYLKDGLSKLFEESKCSYVKWDYNRFITDVRSNIAFGYSFFHRFTLGYYDLISYLSSKFPNIYFEGCSSGGARFDLGSLAYVSQIWTSDNTDPYDRLLIQESTGLCYPISSISNHISASPNQQTDRSFSIKERANVALLGAFGIEMDLREANDEEFSYIKKAVSFYKEHRDIILGGENLLLNSPFSKDLKGQISILGEEAVCLLSSLDGHKGYLKIPSLDKNVTYQLKKLGEDSPFLLSGKELTQKGLFIGAKGKLNTDVYFIKAVSIS